jgi:hypothetical protein
MIYMRYCLSAFTASSSDRLVVLGGACRGSSLDMDVLGEEDMEMDAECCVLIVMMKGWMVWYGGEWG